MCCMRETTLTYGKYKSDSCVTSESMLWLDGHKESIIQYRKVTNFKSSHKGKSSVVFFFFFVRV